MDSFLSKEIIEVNERNQVSHCAHSLFLYKLIFRRNENLPFDIHWPFGESRFASTEQINLHAAFLLFYKKKQHEENE